MEPLSPPPPFVPDWPTYCSQNQYTKTSAVMALPPVVCHPHSTLFSPSLYERLNALISVQTLVLLTNKTSCFPHLIHWDWNTHTAEISSVPFLGFHSPPSTYNSIPPFPFLSTFLCVMMILKMFLQTLFSLRINSLPDTSISPFLQFFTPLYQTYTEAFHSCSRTLLSSTLISGLPSWLFISDPIFNATLRFNQETDSSQTKEFLQITKQYSFGFRQRQTHEITEAVYMARHPMEYKENVSFCDLDRLTLLIIWCVVLLESFHLDQPEHQVLGECHAGHLPCWVMK